MLTVLIGLVMTLVMGFFKLNGTVADAPALVKQIIVIVIAFVANYARVKLGYEMPGDVQSWLISSLTSAVSAFGFYNLYDSHAAPKA